MQNGLLNSKIYLTERQVINLSKIIHNKDTQIKLLKVGVYGMTAVLSVTMGYILLDKLIK